MRQGKLRATFARQNARTHGSLVACQTTFASVQPTTPPPMLDRLPIRTQLLVLVLGVLLPGVGLVAYGLHDRLNEVRHRAEQQLQALAHDTAGRIDVVLQQRAELMARLAERPLVRALDAQHCDPALGDVVALQTDFLTLAVRNRDGEVLCASRPIALPADAVRALPWFRDGLASGSFAAGGAFARPPDGNWVSMLTQPVHNAVGEVGGLLILAVDLRALQRQLLPALPAGTIVVVFDREQHYLMRTTEPARWVGRPLPAAQRAQLPAAVDALFELTGVDGVRRLNVGAEVRTSGWKVYAAMPMAEVDAGYWALLWRSLGLGAAALALASLLIWRIGAGIARPIDALAAGAAAAAGGQAAPQHGAGRSEVATAAAELHRLADERLQLQSRHARLSASHDQLVKAARDIVLLVDPQGRIVQANGAALAAYGYSVEELKAMTVGDLRAPEARALTARDFRAAGRPEGVLFETVHLCKDGRRLPVEVSSHAIEIDGQPFRQSFIRDISARRRDEALLRGQNAVLAQVAQGAPLTQTLDALVRLAEAQSPGLAASILLLDDDGLHLRRGAATSLPRAFIDAIDGMAIGPRAGSCGTAAYRCAPVLSEDIATDTLWDDWRAPALAQGLRACWSTPIVDGTGQVLGTFALYFRQTGLPEPAHQRLVDLVTHTAAIAIVGARSARTQGRQLDELLRWQALMVDREERMRALKAEVDTLRARLGEPSRYAEGEPP